MKVGHVTERTDASSASSFLDSDELERTGIDLGTTGRLQLMARLAEGTGLQIPPAAQQALQMSGSLAFGAVICKPDLPSRMKFWLQLLLYNHLQHNASSFPICLILKLKKKLVGIQKLKMMLLRNVTNMEELSTFMLTKIQLRAMCTSSALQSLLPLQLSMHCMDGGLQVK